MAEYKNNPWMIFSLVLLTALITFGATYYLLDEEAVERRLNSYKDVEVEMEDEDSEIEPESGETEETSVDELEEEPEEYDLPAAYDTGSEQGLLKYTDGVTGLSFEYPEATGWVTQNLIDDGNTFQLDLNGAVFMAASNGGPVPARGGYWGDEAAKIVGLEYMFNNVCPSEGVECEDLVSENGVRYFKVSRKVPVLGEETEKDVVQYMVFNEGNEFRGVMFSSEGLEANLGADALIILDDMMKSLSR